MGVGRIGNRPTVGLHLPAAYHLDGVRPIVKSVHSGGTIEHVVGLSSLACGWKAKPTSSPEAQVISAKSVSSRTLLTGYYPPGFFPSPPHRASATISSSSSAASRTGADRSHARCVWLSLAYFTQQHTGGLGRHVIGGGEPGVMNGGLDRAFKVMGRHAYLIAYSPKPIS